MNEGIIYYHHQEFQLSFYYVIDINGYGLKSLEIGGAPSDHDDLLLLLSSIGKCCRNLEDLTVFYANHLHYYLNDIFSNCRRLKKIYLRLIGGIVIFVDDIVTALIETQPKNLKSIKFGNNINVTDTALVFLCKKWSGPKPFLLSYSNYKQHSIDAVSPIPVLDRCMIMGFLEYEVTDEKPIDYKFYLPSLSSAAINIDLIVASYILNNKKLIEKCFYDHPLLSYVLDLTNYQNSLALYIKSPGPNDTLPLNYVRNIFPGVSGESIISKLKKVLELCSSLDDCQKTTIKDYLLELQSSKLVKSISDEFNPIIDYLYDQFDIIWKKGRYNNLVEPNSSIDEGLWVAEPVHIIMTATTNYLDQVFPQWSAKVCDATKFSVIHNFNYDAYMKGISPDEHKISQKKPDIWATINIDGISYIVW
ncbi:4192_t:CDS:2 [Entrophospora sp. SA101]|nr:4192_t:CDS:2 [Entrophospora sp. SA101]